MQRIVTAADHPHMLGSQEDSYSSLLSCLEYLAASLLWSSGSLLMNATTGLRCNKECSFQITCTEITYNIE
jgi:hypothetical protein